jgi:hypothetical protein
VSQGTRRWRDRRGNRCCRGAQTGALVLRSPVHPAWPMRNGSAPANCLGSPSPPTLTRLTSHAACVCLDHMNYRRLPAMASQASLAATELRQYSRNVRVGRGATSGLKLVSAYTEPSIERHLDWPYRSRPNGPRAASSIRCLILVRLLRGTCVFYGLPLSYAATNFIWYSSSITNTAYIIYNK